MGPAVVTLINTIEWPAASDELEDKQYLTIVSVGVDRWPAARGLCLRFQRDRVSDTKGPGIDMTWADWDRLVTAVERKRKGA